MQIDHELELAVKTAVAQAQAAGDLPAFELPPIRVERPRDPTHGDYAAPAAMQMARLARQAPLQIANAIANHFAPPNYVAAVSVLPPGFINFRLSNDFVAGLVNEIIEQGHNFGAINLGQGKKVQVECVSANPTGPIHIGRTRGGVMGDTLARALRAAGYDVTLEYYYNDAGRQITLLGETTKIRYQQLHGLEVELGDDHYRGNYIIDIAQELKEEHGDGLLDESAEFFGDYAKKHIAKSQELTLKSINIVFDVYYNEQSLYESGRVWRALEDLQERGYVYQKDDAQWFKSTEFGDDQDRVLVKKDGNLTYRMPDIAYHWHKAQRGFDIVIDIFGPDHHATAPQVLMGVKALGYSPDFVQTVLHQIVRLIRDGQEVKMSTRRGTFVALDDLVEDVGADAIRYFMISRSGNSQIDFDLDLAVEHSDKNPVYYIQNAHVRCAGIFRRWVAAGYEADADAAADVSLLTHDNELRFLRKALELTEVLEKVATTYEPHHLAFYAYELAAVFHPAYETCRVLHPDISPELQLARLRFYRAAQTLFARVLDLMGMSAPEVM